MQRAEQSASNITEKRGKKTMKSFFYTNALGRRKELVVYEDMIEEGKIYSSIVDIRTGEICSSGYNTKEEINSFLAKYGISARV